MKLIDGLTEKLYYFSALHGMVQRIMNIDFDRDLVFLHHALNQTHTAFSTRLAAMTRNTDKPITITEEMEVKLLNLLNDLLDSLKNNKDFHQSCIDMIILSYATTGNGYYLMQKGMLTI